MIAASTAADRNRVLAMRLVSSVVNFDPYHAMRQENFLRRDAIFAPKASEWSFIDMDPILDPSDWYALRDDTTFDAQWPIDLALAFPKGDSLTDYRIAHARTVHAKDYRGLVQICSPKMVTIGNMDCNNGRYDWGGGVFSYLGSRWVDACRNGHRRPMDGINWEHQTWSSADHDMDNVSFWIGLMIGAALRHRYEWSVVLNFPSMRARFSTDATGVLRMFRDRNLEPMLARRGPLLHWVSKHWRKRRNVPEDMVEVRKHLRGRSDFLWRGFPVTVIPAEFDVELALRRGEAA